MSAEAPDEVRALASERAERRSAKDYAAADDLRDRITELRRVRASELVPNPRNWRRHPKEQAAALRALLNEIGYAAMRSWRASLQTGG